VPHILDAPDVPSINRQFTYDGAPGCVDALEGPPQTIVRVFGWFSGPILPDCRLHLANGRQLSPLAVARYARPDVRAASLSQELYCGFRADFLMTEGEAAIRLSIAGDGIVLDPDAHRCTVTPHYNGLFNETRVLKRDDIYGYGPPTDASPEIKQFVESFVSGDILDFGCGNGDMVRHLRRSGLNVTGLELDRPRIQNSLIAEARPHVRLYEGGLPLPFDDESFDAIYSVEVIEHIPEIATFISDLRRVLRPGGSILLTTPDISSIPSSYPASCVPWHLLESTHVNFFTPASLEQLFSPGFSLSELFSLSGHRVNGYFVPGSIGARLRKVPLE
jgi:SAM-dependent methyltransferase